MWANKFSVFIFRIDGFCMHVTALVLEKHYFCRDDISVNYNFMFIKTMSMDSVKFKGRWGTSIDFLDYYPSALDRGVFVGCQKFFCNPPFLFIVWCYVQCNNATLRFEPWYKIGLFGQETVYQELFLSYFGWMVAVSSRLFFHNFKNNQEVFYVHSWN